MHVVAWCLIAAVAGAAEPEAVVLEFTAPSRCPPCQQIAPTVSRLQREGFPIRAIDVDTQPNAATPYKIHAVPTFILLIAGREADRIEGKPSEAELRRMCERAKLAAAPNPEIRTPKPEGKPKSKPESLPAPVTKPNALPPVIRSDSAPIFRAKHDGESHLPPVAPVDLLLICPRLRVKDSLGVNFGTGTIIDSREGRTTILTCGHIFRKLNEKSVIDVDVFHGGKHETFVGKLVKFDLEADVGLIWIPTSRPLPTASIGSLADEPTAGQHVFSVGCSGGDAPSKQQHRVTMLNRYLGPDNVECTGVPVQGRSGGGLFDSRSRLIGVCIAADQQDQKGLYAALQPIHDLLDKAELSHLHPAAPKSAKPKIEKPAAPNGDNFLADHSNDEPKFAEAKSPFAVTSASTVSSRETELPTLPEVPQAFAAGITGSPVPINSPAELKTALDESGESEIVCIIRPVKNPRAASRVVIINRASGKFLSQLTGEVEHQAKPTSAVVRQAKYVTSDTESPDSPTTLRAFRRSVPKLSGRVAN